MTRSLTLLLLLGLFGCDDTDSAPIEAPQTEDVGAADAGPLPLDVGATDVGALDARSVDATVDATVDASAGSDGGFRFGRRPQNPPAGDLPAPRGWRNARGLIHMHNIYSHDACDGMPIAEDGTPNWPCHERFRSAICYNRHDFILMTDHPSSITERTIEEALFNAGTDVLESGPEGPNANRIFCDDGHEVLLTAGSEGDLMPVMFKRMPPAGALRDLTPEGAERLKTEAGALVFQAHMERFTAEQARPLRLDGMEIYNIHANLDPRGEILREVFPDITTLLAAKDESAHPDLWFTAIFREGFAALKVWNDTIATERMLGFAGSDTHENIPLPFDTGDGERIESYRRIGGWFSNWLLLDGTPTYDRVRAALEAGRLYAVFDVLGAPRGFDFHATQGETVLEMGTEAPLAAGATLHIVSPQAPAEDTVEVRLLRVSPQGVEVIAQTTEGTLDIEAPGPGAYRVEVRLTAEHLRPEMGIVADEFIRPQVWIYSNPVYLR